MIYKPDLDQEALFGFDRIHRLIWHITNLYPSHDVVSMTLVDIGHY